MLAPLEQRSARTRAREESPGRAGGGAASHPVAARLNGSARVRQLHAQGMQLNRGTAADRPANRTGLPEGLKAGLERLSGLSMDDVRVHYASPRPAQLRAHAFAQGTDIHLAPGQDRHLPHEAWHVVQQKQGRVRPTLSLAGTAVNDDRALEAEADQLGGQASRFAGARPALAASGAPPVAPVVQGFWGILAGALAAAGALGLGYFGWRQHQQARREPDRRRMVRDIVAESDLTRRRHNIEFTGSPDVRSETGRGNVRGLPGYRININPNDPISADATGQLGPDRRLRQTAMIHELTHVAVSEGYGGRNRGLAEIGENMRARRVGQQPSNEEMAERGGIIRQIDRLDRIRLADPVLAQLPQGRQDYIRDRIEYMAATPTAEFDTVLNELVMHFHMWNISPQSPLSVALVDAARERMALRNAL